MFKRQIVVFFVYFVVVLFSDSSVDSQNSCSCECWRRFGLVTDFKNSFKVILYGHMLVSVEHVVAAMVSELLKEKGRVISDRCINFM